MLKIFLLSVMVASISFAAEHPGQLSAEAWTNVFSKSAAGFLKRPVVPGVSLLAADSHTVKSFYGFFPSLSEINYLSCATKLDAAFGAQLASDSSLQYAGFIVFEPTTVTENQKTQEGVLLTWMRLLPGSKTQEVRQQALPARVCQTDGIATFITGGGKSKPQGVSAKKGVAVDLAQYVQTLQSTERMEARAQQGRPNDLRASGQRAPASAKDK